MSDKALTLEIIENNIAVVTFDLPGARANTMGFNTAGDFEDILHQLESNDSLRGLIIRSGKPGMYIAGADINDIMKFQEQPELVRNMIPRGLEIIRRFESLPFPTVAAIDGSCMGGGLELSVALDYRIVSDHPKTVLGVPEVKIGLYPGWGGTQRLPRLVGMPIAIEMITSGDPVNARRAVDIGLASAIVPGDRLMDEAKSVIEKAHTESSWQKSRASRQQPMGLTEDQIRTMFKTARDIVISKTKGHYPAPLAALDVLERTCNMNVADGLAVESDNFFKLLGGDVSRNMIALFFMNQRIQTDSGISDPKIKLRDISQVGVLGAGIMGSGIAGAFVRKGIPALMIDSVPSAVEKGILNIQKVLQTRVKLGLAKPEATEKALAILRTGNELSAMSDRPLVIEAIVENEDVKVKVYKELCPHLADRAILASNTSTISITRMARSVQNPERFVGMHFFNPVDRMQLVEVIRGEKTDDETVATIVALVKKLGKSPIVVNDCPGFLVNRILFMYINEAMALLEEGAAPRELDKVATSFGMPMGPVLLQDVVGIDTAVFAGGVVNDAFPERAVTTSILQELASAGRMGQKSGAGFYTYAAGAKKGADDPALDEILSRCRKSPREIGQEEMVDRLFLPMIQEASLILQEGVVRDAADVDMGLILGIGFPAHRGGLLRWSDSLGIEAIVEKLKKYEHLGPRFVPTNAIEEMAANGSRFYSQ